MYPLFESIKLVDDKIFCFDEHYLRMTNSSRVLWHHEIHLPQLERDIRIKSKNGLQKCKILYNQYDYEIDIQPYVKRKINRLHLVSHNEIEYDYKYTNRKNLLHLSNQFPENDDIIIIKNNYLTDTSYSNLACWNGREWHTPKIPLFAGIKRKKLLEQNLIHEKDITIDHIQDYSKFCLINAMLNLSDIEISIENVMR